MKKKFDDYELLHKNRRHGSLWLGPDHLLVVERFALVTSFREHYRRLDYDSIQGIFTAHTATRAWVSALHGLWLAVCLLIAMAVWNDEREVGEFFLGFALLPIIGLIINLARGKTSGLVVRTAVRAWRLKAVGRQKAATKVAQALTQRCAEAQGGVLESPALGSMSTAAQPPSLPGHLRQDDVRTEPPHWTIYAGYTCLVLFGGLMAGELSIEATWYSLCALVAGSAALALLFSAVTRRGGMARTGGKGVWYFSIVSLLALGIGAYLVSFFRLVASTVEYTPLSILETIAEFPHTGMNVVVIQGFLALAACCIVGGGVGIAAAWHRHRKNPASEQGADAGTYMR